MRPKLNLLKSDISKNVSEAQVKDELTYWKYYLSIISVEQVPLTPTEIEVLAYILSKDVDKDYFKGPPSAQVVRNFKFTRQQFWNYKKSFLNKGYLQKEDTNYYIEPNLKALQRFVKRLITNKQELELSLPFKIVTS